MSDAAEILKNMDVTLSLAEGDIVTDVVVIARVSNLAEDSTSIALTFNKGQDWLVRLGMMESALLIERDVYRVRSLEYGDE
jgi:hypothetical protein